WHRHAAVAVVIRRGAGRETDRAGVDAAEYDLFHLRDLGGGGGAPGRILTHHVGAHRRVPHEARDVQRHSLALEHVEELRDGLALPARAGTQHLERHALDLREIAHAQLALRSPSRGTGEAADVR